MFVKADSEIDYGTVIDLLNQIRMAGYRKIGLVGVQNSLKSASSGAVNNKIPR
ncbi:hypothetical protein [Bartonella sp. TT121SHDZB]|uniref:hypothetical protein n=1 Tax=Bartonella sp. TT121SHDZB TaxID=3243580 RepID=UPI0035D045B5